MILSCCVGCHLLFHLQLGLQVFCMSSMHRSVPSEPSRSERRLWLMSWTRSPFVSWAEWRCSESCWRNLSVCISTAWSNIQLNTDSGAEYRFQLCLSACPVKPSTVNDLWKDKGWRFLRKFTCWSIAASELSCCMWLYRISKKFLQHFIFGWVLMELELDSSSLKKKKMLHSQKYLRMFLRFLRQNFTIWFSSFKYLIIPS